MTNARDVRVRRASSSADPPPLILLGDLVRALRSLRIADTSTRSAVAELLGLRTADVAAEPADPDADDEVSTLPTGPVEHEEHDIRRGLADLVAPAQQSGPRPVPSRLERVASGDEVPAWVADVEPLEEAAPRRVDRDPEPLLVPRWSPAIVVAAAATAAPDGPVDTERTVSLLASGQALVDVPRLATPTVRRGAQVLVDIGPGMLPFTADQRQLEVSLRVALGVDRVEVLHFEGLPTRGAGAAGRAAWEPYEPPVRGKPVIVVSDLGAGPSAVAGDAATPDEWLAFADVVRRAGCPLVAFVPCLRRRLPLSLVRAFRVVEWDRTTTATSVRAMLGPLPMSA